MGRLLRGISKCQHPSCQGNFCKADTKHNRANHFIYSKVITAEPENEPQLDSQRPSM